MERKKLQTRIIGLLIVMAGTISISACNDDDEVTPVVDDIAFVSIYNASPNSPALRLVVDNRQINSYPFEYADNTGYLRFFAGERTLQFGPFDANNIVSDTTVTFEDDEIYSLFLTGNYPNIQPLILQDNSNTPTEGNAMIRFLHLSPDAPAIRLNTESGETIVETRSFREATEFMEIEANTYDFVVETVAGSQEVLNVPNVNLQEGWYYTFIVRGYADPQDGNTNELRADILVD